MEEGSGSLRCSVFGGVGLQAGDTPLALRGKQRRRLVAALLAASPQPVTTARLIWLLTPDETAANRAADPANAVHAHIKRLRHLLEPQVNPIDARWLRSRPDGYLLEPDWLDLWSYRAEVATAERQAAAAPEEAIAAYERAFSLWATPFGDLASDESVSDMVRDLEQAHLDHEDACTDVRLAAGLGGEAVTDIVAAARAEPLREHRWSQGMQALFQASRQADALRLYGTARDILVGELGLEPGPELRRTEQQILDHDPVLLGRSRRSTTRRTPATTFVGRTSEIDLLDRLIERHRVVSITGLGGAGKTRLAMEWLSRSPRGRAARWVDLSGVASNESARHRIATDVGIGGSSLEPIDPIELVVALLDDATRLIVVDNAEAHSAVVADLVSRATSELRHIRFLVTSRVPLGLTGETVVALSPLPVPGPEETIAGTAVELVMDRLGAEADQHLARQLAHRFGGLPYPLELAAAAQRFSPAAPGHAIERDGSADAAVAEALDMALGQLSDDAIDVLWTTMKFPDGVTTDLLDAAHRQAGPDFPSRHRDRLLRELVGASLLGTGAGASGVRYRGAAPLAEHAADRLPATVATNRVLAVAEWWSTRARSTFFEPPSREGLNSLRAEHRNIVHVLGELQTCHPEQALDLAVRMVDHWERSGHTAEGASWVRAVASRIDPESPLQALGTSALVACSGGIAMNAQFQPQLEHSRRLLIASDGAHGDIWAVLHLQLALARGWNGDLAGSDEAFAEAAAQARSAGSDWFDAVLYRYGALRFALTGEPLRGHEQAVDAASRLEALDDVESAAGSLYFASVLGRMAGVSDLTELLSRARSLADRAGAVHMESLIVVEQGQAARRRGDPAAPDLLAEGAALTERSGNLRTGSVTRRDLGLHLLELGQRDRSAEQLARATRHLLLLDERAAALGLAGLSVLADSQPTLASELATAAWGCAEQGTGAPIPEGDRLLLESLVGRTVTGSPPRDPGALLADAAALLVTVGA